MKNRLSAIRLVVACAVCAACELSAPWRQASAQGTDAPRRPNAPPPPPFHFPAIHEHILPNGLRLLVVEDHSIPLVSARVILPDASTDPIGREGLDSLMIGALREGTSSKDATQLAESFADIGATIQPTRFTVTTDAAPAAMALVADMLVHPSFDSAGIERRRASQAATARAMAGIPSFAARHLFHAIVYGPDEDAVRALLVNDARVNALTRDDIAAHYRQFVGPKTTTIVLAGDLSDASALTLATRVFGTWASPADAHVASTGVASPRPTTIYLYDVPASPDAFFVVGNAAQPRTSPALPAADVVAAVASMRMQLLMRERRSLMYSGSSGMLWPAAPRPSVLVGSTRFPAAKADTALTTWLGFLRDLHTGQSITPQELDAARRSLLGNLVAGMDGPDLLADRVAELARSHVSLDSYDAYYAAMSRLTLADVNAAAIAFVDADHLTIAVAGPRAQLEPTLRAANLAPVVIVDANGNVLP